jgi:hypothetical protein
LLPSDGKGRPASKRQTRRLLPAPSSRYRIRAATPKVLRCTVRPSEGTDSAAVGTGGNVPILYLPVARQTRRGTSTSGTKTLSRSVRLKYFFKRLIFFLHARRGQIRLDQVRFGHAFGTSSRLERKQTCASDRVSRQNAPPHCASHMLRNSCAIRNRIWKLQGRHSLMRKRRPHSSIAAYVI